MPCPAGRDKLGRLLRRPKGGDVGNFVNLFIKKPLCFINIVMVIKIK